MTGRLKSQCACRAVTYRVDDAFEYAMICHCSNCRRVTGSAFKPMGGIRLERLEVESGADLLAERGDTYGHDVFCKGCGSLVWSVVRGGAWVHVTYGTLVDPPSLAPQCHIFVGSKAPWDQITDALPQHAASPGAS